MILTQCVTLALKKELLKVCWDCIREGKKHFQNLESYVKQKVVIFDKIYIYIYI